MMTNSPDKENLRDRIDNMKSLINASYLLECLGLKITRETVKEIRGACIIHKGDNTTSFRYNKENNTWLCFSHRCHEQNSSDVIGLVMAVNGYGFMDALEYLEDLTGSNSVNQKKLCEYRRKKEREKFIRGSGISQHVPDIVDDKVLKYYKPFRSSFFLEDGFKEDTLDYFEIAGGYSDADGLIRDIIPIRDDSGKLVAYSLRDIRRKVKNQYKKYKLTPGFDKDSVLYNLDKIKEFVGLSPLIIVEGFKSVWRLYELGIFNVVACMGSGITAGQALLLYTYAMKGVVLFFDNDKAGAKGAKSTIDLIDNKLKVYLEVITEQDENGKGLDPFDLTDDQIFYYLKNYI